MGYTADDHIDGTWLLARLRRTGASDKSLMMTLSAQTAWVDSVARQHLSERRAEVRTGVSSEEFWNSQAPTLVEAMSSGAFPTMAQLSDDTFDFSYEQLLEFGLKSLHDGFAPLLDGR